MRAISQQWSLCGEEFLLGPFKSQSPLGSMPSGHAAAVRFRRMQGNGKRPFHEPLAFLVAVVKEPPSAVEIYVGLRHAPMASANKLRTSSGEHQPAWPQEWSQVPKTLTDIVRHSQAVQLRTDTVKLYNSGKTLNASVQPARNSDQFTASFSHLIVGTRIVLDEGFGLKTEMCFGTSVQPARIPNQHTVSSSLHLKTQIPW